MNILAIFKGLNFLGKEIITIVVTVNFFKGIVRGPLIRGRGSYFYIFKIEKLKK